MLHKGWLISEWVKGSKCKSGHDSYLAFSGLSFTVSCLGWLPFDLRGRAIQSQPLHHRNVCGIWLAPSFNLAQCSFSSACCAEHIPFRNGLGAEAPNLKDKGWGNKEVRVWVSRSSAWPWSSTVARPFHLVTCSKNARGKGWGPTACRLNQSFERGWSTCGISCQVGETFYWKDSKNYLRKNNNLKVTAVPTLK